MYKISVFEKMEDWFLRLKGVDNTWIEDCYFSLCRLKHKVIDFIYYTPKTFIYNIFVYRKVLKDDYWFDSHYLFFMLKEKLEHDASMYRKNGLTVSAEKYAEQMEYCVKILQKLCRDEYEACALKSHDEKWGELNFDIGNENIFNSSRKHVITEEDKEQEKKEFLECVKIASNEQEKDVKNLFQFMGKNILYWGD